MPRSKCLWEEHMGMILPEAEPLGMGHKAKGNREPVTTRLPHSRFSKDIERSNTLRRLWRVQVVQACHRVDNTEEDCCLHPVVHQVGVGQASWGQVTSLSGGQCTDGPVS